MGLEKVIMKQDKLIGYFIADQQSNFYQTETFSIILQAVQQQPRVLRMKEKQTRGGLRLLLTVDKVKTVDRAYEILNTILPVVEKV